MPGALRRRLASMTHQQRVAKQADTARLTTDSGWPAGCVLSNPTAKARESTNVLTQTAHQSLSGALATAAGKTTGSYDPPAV